jgi:hypothetical protein
MKVGVRQMAGTRRSEERRGKPVWMWVVAAILAVVLFVTLWVAIRAILARDELLAAVPIAESVGSGGIAALGGDIEHDVDAIQVHARRAESLTSDFIWRGAEFIPGVGANLVAFRESAAMISDVADEALPPLVELAKTFTIESLAPVGGAFDLDVFEDAAPLLRSSSDALAAADQKASEIDTVETIEQIGTAVDEVKGLVSRARAVVIGLDTAASLLPTMLGGDEPRSYLLLSLNNAELRAAGGIPGAVAVLNAADGKIELGVLSTASALGEFGSPPLPLTASENTLYNSTMGTYLQNVTATPEFPRSGELAKAPVSESTESSPSIQFRLATFSRLQVLSMPAPA